MHESNAVPGLTTQRLAKVADRVMVGYEDSRQHYHHPDRVVVTGTPVRGEFFRLTRQQARDALGIRDDRPLVLSYWGSLGAEVMNGYMTDFIRRAVREGAPFHHIHGAGRNYGAMQKALAGVSLPPEIQLREYIYDMPTVMVAADLVLCRGGASTLSELTAISLSIPARHRQAGGHCALPQCDQPPSGEERQCAGQTGGGGGPSGACVQRGHPVPDHPGPAGRAPAAAGHGPGHGEDGDSRRGGKDL